MSEAVRGSAAPLFDRLAPQAGATNGPLIVGIGQLRRSIGVELSRLLGTRSGLTFEQFVASDGGVIGYGIPDASALSMRSIEDRATLRAAIAHGIALYCPRLSNVAIEIDEGAVCGADARVRIGGTMRLGALTERATFAMRSGVEIPRVAAGENGE
ncbi:type VI secretion system baseplate subunit TssE [Robbsia sp. Bb-Pol-6]|uniref:Type VI secretion system baseplate subunit TssE n=1 Tax=Robbsia betulipollinis TaxID=2981849 RepID=A0ABT3ZPH1_9BURK|nr:type VI secretion system baseplate subunit TssE [Robbsia betulipollinis]MCY0388377.1 type VI secretion system baseplate subunit TssE [Robbsia betulipollinis]